MTPYNYIAELLDTRLDRTDDKVVWVDDWLYWEYSGSIPGMYAVEEPTPNRMYKGRVIRPISEKPRTPQPARCCCCCCKNV